MRAAVVFAALRSAAGFRVPNATTEVVNPDRGWYQHWEVRAGTANFPTLRPSAALRLHRSGYALVLYLVYLELDSVPPVAELLGDLAALVAGGVKAVVRFAYSSVRGALPTEPEPAAVLAHIQALAPVFNAPGVVTVQVDQRKVGCTSAQI